MFGDLTKLPQELKNATATANAAFKRYQKAISQREMWEKEQELASQAFTVAQGDHSAVLNRWNPDTNEMTPLEQCPSPSGSK